MVTGDRSNGKTRALLHICLKMAREQGRKFDIEKDIYYTEVGNLAYRVLTEKNLIIGIDEGYFAAKNTKILERKVSNLLDNLTAARNRGHTIVICFMKFNRAAKTLLEICNYWLHKPNLDYGILYIRDREFVGDDPWSVEDLLKAKGLYKKRWLMKHNPNYIATVKVRKLKKAIFDKYEAQKEKQQEEHAHMMNLREQFAQQTAFIIDKLYDDFGEGKFHLDLDNINQNDRELRIYLSTKYGIPTPKAKPYMDGLKSKLISERAYKNAQKGEEAQDEPPFEFKE